MAMENETGTAVVQREDRIDIEPRRVTIGLAFALDVAKT